MDVLNRRQFVGSCAASLTGLMSAPVLAQIPGERPARDSAITVLNPANRIPVSLIIDDSTCLANLAHFAIPQFQEVFPDRYLQPWKTLPREIPDDFVRKFMDWCGEHGLRGKYSVVPYPACVGWIDRDLPGWSRRELESSLELVRRQVVPHWDIHPEMVSHTWAIDTRTGRPYPERTEQFMENWGFSVRKSADELAEYLAFALTILRNVGLPCEGITTPGGFGNQVLAELAQATLESCRDVFSAEIPHYFRHLYTDERSVAPQVQYVRGLGSADPKCVVSIIGCTGDWFGGWDGLEIGSADQFLTEDGNAGRVGEVIRRGEPAIMVSHWPGMYCNGDETGFEILKTVVGRLATHYANLIWMKNSQIARYWAARELTGIALAGQAAELSAPFACENFTLRLPTTATGPLALRVGNERNVLNEIRDPKSLVAGTWVATSAGPMACLDLPRGTSLIAWA